MTRLNSLLTALSLCLLLLLAPSGCILAIGGDDAPEPGPDEREFAVAHDDEWLAAGDASASELWRGNAPAEDAATLSSCTQACDLARLACEFECSGAPEPFPCMLECRAEARACRAACTAASMFAPPTEPDDG